MVLAVIVVLPPAAFAGGPAVPAPRAASPPVSAQRPLELSPPPPAGPAGAGPLVAPDARYDWNTFRGDVQRDADSRAESTLASGNISNLTPLWSFDAGAAVEGSPTVVGGVVYFGAWNGYEYALNASNGSMIWRTFVGVTPSSATLCTYAPDMGVTSSAAVVNGTVYVGGGNSYWYALNATNGSVLGKVFVSANPPSGGNYNWASPLVVGNFAYIGIASGCDNPLVQGGVLMVNISDPATLSNASVVHRFYDTSSADPGNSVWASPSYDPSTNSVFVATGNYGTSSNSYSQAVIALNATDLAVRASWQVLSTPNSDSDFSGGPMVFPGPDGYPMVVAINKDGYDYALNASDVSAGPVWKYAISNPRWGYGPAASNGTSVYLTGGDITVPNATTYLGSVVALSTAGRVEWTHYASGFVQGGASYADGLVFDAAVNTTSISSAGYRLNTTLEALSAANGSRLAALELRGWAVNSTLTVSDGRLYAGYAGQWLNASGGVIAFGLPLRVSASATANGAAGDFNFSARVTGGSPSDTFEWSFGDGTFSMAAAPAHDYATAGNFTVDLTVRDALGDVANTNVTVTSQANATPLTAQLAADPAVGVAPLVVHFSLTPTGGTPPYAEVWAFGDADGDLGVLNVSHTYVSAGTFLAYANVTDADGRRISTSATIVVATPLTAAISATPTNGTAPLPVHFTGTIIGGIGPYTTGWSFGDGSPNATGPNVTHSFVTAGQFAVAFRVTDSVGESSTADTDVAVAPAPFSVTASAVGVVGCSNAQGDTALFTADASGGLPPFTFSWSFGDGAVSDVGPQVSHTYASEFTGSVSLRMTDSNGTPATATTVVRWTLPSCPPPRPTGTTSGAVPSLAFVLEVGVAGGLSALAVAGLVLWLRRTRRRPPV